jgi:Na+-transporting methylmalonyl-CoA/oxaloacetate decarboxylase gamma subunit
MSPRLSHEARSFLDDVRAAEDPTPADEERVKHALDASIAAAVTCHWERYPVRGDAAGPPAPDLGTGGAVVAKAGAVAWGAPLSVIALCAAALFASGDAHRMTHERPISAPAAAPSAAPDQRGERLATVREAATADAGAPREASARSAAVGSRSKASSRRSNAAAAKRPASSGLAAELALLQRAQAALRRGDGAGALRELGAFPGTGGQLLAERRAASVLAFCSLGRVAEARTLWAELVRTDPDSVQRAALERSCANPSRNHRR